MRQRGGSWQLIVHAGRDPVTGKKRYVSRTVKGTKREAQRALAALVTQTGHGVPADTATTVSQLLDAWFARARTDFLAEHRPGDERHHRALPQAGPGRGPSRPVAGP